MLFNQVGDIFNRELLVENALRLDDHDRALGAEALAACRDHLDFILEPSRLDLRNQCIADLERLGGNTSGARAHEELGPAGPVSFG